MQLLPSGDDIDTALQLSQCDETFPGEYHSASVDDWGCYRGQRDTTSPAACKGANCGSWMQASHSHASSTLLSISGPESPVGPEHASGRAAAGACAGAGDAWRRRGGRYAHLPLRRCPARRAVQPERRSRKTSGGAAAGRRAEGPRDAPSDGEGCDGALDRRVARGVDQQGAGPLARQCHAAPPAPALDAHLAARSGGAAARRAAA